MGLEQKANDHAHDVMQRLRDHGVQCEDYFFKEVRGAFIDGYKWGLHCASEGIGDSIANHKVPNFSTEFQEAQLLQDSERA